MVEHGKQTAPPQGGGQPQRRNLTEPSGPRAAWSRRRWRAANAALAIAASAAILIAAFLPPGSGLGPPCLWRSLLGIPCPGCGLGRSLVLSAHGLFRAAFRMHPLGPPLLAALAALAVWAAMAAMLGRRGPIPFATSPWTWAAGIAAFWACWIIRLALHCLPP